MTTDKSSLTADARATIMDACQSISRSADGVKAGCAIGDEWPDAEDKAFYDAELRLLGRLTALLAAHPAQPEPRAEVTDAARDVLAERRRQVEQEGWLPKHDDAHSHGEMALAAACYAAADNENYPPAEPPDLWPWHSDWWKPTTERRNLVKAAALLLAEIERIDRAAPHAGAN